MTFRTKSQLVIDMLGEEIAAGTLFRYLCADAGYGRDPHLRAFCHEHALGYVMAVPVDLPLAAVRGGAEPVGHVLDRLLARGVPQIWERRSCGNGSKGARAYDWTAVAVAEQAPVVRATLPADADETADEGKDHPSLEAPPR